MRCLPPLKLAIEELKGSIHLFFSQAMYDEGTSKSGCLKETDIPIIVKNPLSGSPEGIICPSILRVGDDDMLSKQVKCLIQDLAHLSFIAWHDQVRGVDHHLQARGLHRGKQRVAVRGGTHHIGPLWLKGQRHLLFLSDAQGSLHSA